MIEKDEGIKRLHYYIRKFVRLGGNLDELVKELQEIVDDGSFDKEDMKKFLTVPEDFASFS